MPAPGQMPSGSYMDTIQKRGRLIAGVSADTLLLGARNPVSGRIEGFDIDMLRAVSQAIFGDPNKIELQGDHRRPAPAGAQGRQRRHRGPQHDDHLRPLEGDRLLQRVLPLRPEGAGPARARRPRAAARSRASRTSRARRSARPTGRRAWTSCAPSRASRPSGPTPTPAAWCCSSRARSTPSPVTTRCSPGLAAQDPYAEVVQAPAFTAEPYGLGVNQEHVDFVRFVNGVLDGDAGRRPLDQELQHLAGRRPGQGAGPAAAGLRTDAVIAAMHSATAPTAPAGSASRSLARMPCATSRRWAPGATSARRSSTCSTRPRSAPLTGRRTPATCCSRWPCGRRSRTGTTSSWPPGTPAASGTTELERLSTLVWGRLDAGRRVPPRCRRNARTCRPARWPSRCPRPAGSPTRSPPRCAPGWASTRRRPTSRRGCVRCAPRSNGSGTSSTANRPQARAAASSTLDRLDTRTADVLARAKRGADVGGLLGPLEQDAARAERDLIVGASNRRAHAHDEARARALRAELEARGAALRDLAARCVAQVAPAPRLAVPDVSALGPVPDRARRRGRLPGAAGRRRPGDDDGPGRLRDGPGRARRAAADAWGRMPPRPQTGAASSVGAGRRRPRRARSGGPASRWTVNRPTSCARAPCVAAYAAYLGSARERPSRTTSRRRRAIMSTTACTQPGCTGSHPRRLLRRLRVPGARTAGLRGPVPRPSAASPAGAPSRAAPAPSSTATATSAGRPGRGCPGTRPRSGGAGGPHVSVATCRPAWRSRPSTVSRASNQLASTALGSARAGAGGSKVTRRVGTSSTRLRGARLGAGLTSIPPVPAVDAAGAVLEEPDGARGPAHLPVVRVAGGPLPRRSARTHRRLLPDLPQPVLLHPQAAGR